MHFKICILGTGNLFTPEFINTSFLIQKFDLSVLQECYLVDCGFNVYQTLVGSPYFKPLIKDISEVYITHTHPDHIGSLGALIFYRYFVHQKITRIYCGRKCYDPLKNILEATVGFVSPHDCSSSKVYNTDKPYLVINEEDNPKVSFFEVVHPAGPNNGCYGFHHKECNTLFTGDTGLLNPRFRLFEMADFIFHDVDFDFYVPSVHTHFRDIEMRYNDTIMPKMYGVHHGKSVDRVLMYNNKKPKFKLAYEGQEIECHPYQ